MGEVPNKTLLPYFIYSKSTNTPSLCTAACAEMGYRFAGVKWSTECWCGDTEPPSSSYTAPAQCNMPCAGDQKIMCGAGSVLNLYRKNTAQDEIVKVWFNPLTKDVNKIASPFGGLIIVYLKDYEATTKEKMFDVKIDNAVLAPHFSLGINSNMDWNKMKKYSPPFAVLRVPGQMHIYMQTKHLQGVTDMEALLKNWKVTLDILDSLLGIPLNLQPGEEQLHYNPSIGGGNRYHVCDGGGKSRVDADYWKGFVDYKRKHPTVVFHELGHGYCYSDMPDMGGQWI